MSIANFTEAERTMRELLESLRKQVAAAIDQSQRLSAGISEAHQICSTVYQTAERLPDPAVLNDRIETGLAEAQSKLDEMVQATLTRVAGQMRRAKSDLEVLVTDTVMAFERSAEHARRTASGISRTVDEKLNRAAQRGDEIVAMLEAQGSPSQLKQAQAIAQLSPDTAPMPLQEEPSSAAETIPANGQFAFTLPPSMWAMAITSAMNQVPASPPAPPTVPQPAAIENLEAIEHGLSERVDQLMSQVQSDQSRPRNVEITDAAA